MIPSWKVLVAWGETLPGTAPPMSQRCPQVSVNPMSSPSWKTGMTNAMSGRCETAPYEA